MDKYINLLFIKLSQRYKVTIVTIMSYNEEYNRTTKNFKLVIDNKENTKKPIERQSLDFRGKRDLIQAMIKWGE
jgi:hypothetical protein